MARTVAGDLRILLVAERGAPAQQVTESLLAAAFAIDRDSTGADPAEAAKSLLRRSAPWVLDLEGALRACLEDTVKDADREIFVRAELGWPERESLRLIASDLGISDQRVGRRRDRASAQLRARASAASAPLGWAVRHCANYLGAASPVEQTAELLFRLGLAPSQAPLAARAGDPRPAGRADEADAFRTADLLLWLAGPYRRDDRVPGWLVRTSSGAGRLDLVRLTRGLLTADGGVRPLVDVAVALRRIGMLDTLLPGWVNACGAAAVDQAATAWLGGSIHEALERLLEASGRRMTADECRQLFGAGGRHVDVSEVEQALRAPRFRAVRRGFFELAAWASAGAGKYAPGTKPHLAPRGTQAIQSRAEGPTTRALDGALRGSSEQTLFKSLGLDGDLAPAEAADDLQIVSGPSNWHQSEAAALPERRQGPEGEMSEPCDGRVVWFGIDVDKGLLSGLPGQAPESLIRSLGVGWHERRTFASRYGPVTISNDGTEPSHSSLRPLAFGIGAAPGDRLMLGFGAGGHLVVELRLGDGTDSDR